MAVPRPAIHRAASRHLAVVREKLKHYAEQAGARDSEETAYQLQILMMGAIVSASQSSSASVMAVSCAPVCANQHRVIRVCARSRASFA